MERYADLTETTIVPKRDEVLSESAQHDFQGRHSPCSTILRYGNFLPGNVEQDVPNIAAALRATARIAGLALFESRRLGRTDPT
jgi:hypothetical protein